MLPGCELAFSPSLPKGFLLERVVLEEPVAQEPGRLTRGRWTRAL
jgi:hypothetical protein